MSSLLQRSKESTSRERMEAPLSSSSPIPSQEAIAHKRGGEEADGGSRKQGGGSKEAGGSGKIPVIVITNLTVGPDGCGGWAICFG